MSLPKKTQTPDDTQEHLEVIGRRLLKNAIVDRAGEGLDALQVHRFQALGLLEGVVPPMLPASVLEVLSGANHPGATLPDGPLLFVRDGDHVVVIEVATLLLNPDRTIRVAALQHSRGANPRPGPWLSPASCEILDRIAEQLQSDSIDDWRSAGIAAASAVRNDLFGDLAGLRQCIRAAFPEGRTSYLLRALRPTFESLAPMRPPVWDPKEQRDEISRWIDEWAELPTAVDALKAYCGRCGYLPLSEGMSAAELLRRWQAKHSGLASSGREIWRWAIAGDDPLLRYHATVIAMRTSAMSDVAADELLESVLVLLNRPESDAATVVRSERLRLRCDLAAHYCDHIESVLPGQDGDRVACYAWWLADRVAAVLAPDEGQARRIADSVVKNERSLSEFRSSFTRSPTSPSSIFYATSYRESVWALSILAHLTRRTSSASPLGALPNTQHRITEALQDYCTSSPLTRMSDQTACFAFHENEQLLAFAGSDALVVDDARDGLTALIEWRRAVLTPEDLREWLRTVGERSEEEAVLFALALQEEAVCTNRSDVLIFAWLEDAAQVAKTLQQVALGALNPLSEALSVFQQRAPADLATRLPHIFAFAIENTDDKRRAQLLCISALLMSINIGVVSAIQRVLGSKWRSQLLDQVSTWRRNLREVTPWCEPWAGARIRATSAAISRIIGPLHDERSSELDAAEQFE